MQAMASLASMQLACSSLYAPSYLCTSRFLEQSIARLQCLRIRLPPWHMRRSRNVVSASRDWPSSRAGPSRGVVSDEVEGIPVGEYGERYLVPNHMDDDEDGFGDVRVECNVNGCVIDIPESRTLADEDNGSNYLQCNLSGCYFTLEAPASRSFEVIEGEGWRLGYETAPDSERSFCAIVGAGGWSIALTGGEFNDFCYLIQSMRKGILSMDGHENVEKDDVVLQIEKGSVWMECKLPKTRVGALQLLWRPGVPENLVDKHLKHAFEIRFVLSADASKRQAEGYWPADAVLDMLTKIDSSFNEPGAPFFENVPRR